MSFNDDSNRMADVDAAAADSSTQEEAQGEETQQEEQNPLADLVDGLQVDSDDSQEESTEDETQEDNQDEEPAQEQTEPNKPANGRDVALQKLQQQHSMLLQQFKQLQSQIASLSSSGGPADSGQTSDSPDLLKELGIAESEFVSGTQLTKLMSGLQKQLDAIVEKRISQHRSVETEVRSARKAWLEDFKANGPESIRNRGDEVLDVFEQGLSDFGDTSNMTDTQNTALRRKLMNEAIYKVQTQIKTTPVAKPKATGVKKPGAVVPASGARQQTKAITSMDAARELVGMLHRR